MKRSLLIALVVLLGLAFVSVPARAGDCPQSQCVACIAAALEGEDNYRLCLAGIDPATGRCHTTSSILCYSSGSGWRICYVYSLGKYSCGWSPDDQVVVYKSDGTLLVFRRSSPWRNYGDAGTPVQSNYALSGDNTAQNMTLTRSSQHGKVVYEFYGFTGSNLDGKLISRTVGDPAGSSQTTTFAYNGSAQLTSTTDEFGRTTTYQYTSGANSVLSKVIESHPGDPTNPLNNTHGKVTRFVYEGGNMVREEVGVPKTVAADAGDDGDTAPTSTDYYWRRTGCVYNDEGQLTHVIPPEQYDAWAASTEPDRNEKYATQVYEYYPTGHAYAGKVKAQSGSGCGCGGGGVVLGTEYTYPDPLSTKLYLGETEPDNENAPTYQMNVYRWEDGAKRLIKVLQMNDNEQPLFQLTRADDNVGLLKAYKYNSDYQADNIIHYDVQFDWEDPDNATYTADNLITGNRFTHDASLRRTAMATWDGADCVTITEWGYVDDTRFVDNETAHVDGATTLVTEYIYDADNRLVCTVHPQVLSTQNSYDGSSYDVNYYLGERTFYDAYGRVTERRSVKLSNTPADWPTVATDLDNLASTKYYYADDDDLDSDGDGTTDEVDGSEGFELTRTVVDEGGLNLETRYQYAVVGGRWLKTAQIVDPDNHDGLGGTYLNLVTTYDYTTVNPEDGAWGNPTLITEPEAAYKTTVDYNAADRILTRTDTCGSEVVSATRYHYCKYGKACSTTQAVGFPEEQSTVTEWDECGRTKRVYSNVADLAWANGSWSGTVRGNVTEYHYILGTDRTRMVKQKAGWAACAPTVIGTYTYTADGKQSVVTDAVGNETSYAYEKGSGNLDNVTNALGHLTHYEYDNQTRLLTTELYDNTAMGTLWAKSESKYDSLSRVYESIEYNPDNQSCTIVVETWHDPLGRVKKHEDPNDHATVHTYDAAGRNTCVEDALGNKTYSTYDPAGRATVQETTHVAGLGSNRREFSVSFYDANGRVSATAVYGTNDPSATTTWPAQPVLWDADNVPTSPGVSDDNHLVSTYAYGCDSTYGSYACSTDPMGIQRFAYVDRIGRSTRTVESKDGIDRITLYAYDQPVSGKGYVQDTITARNGSYNDQVTTYIRADTADAGRVTTTVYPDTGEVVVAYNADGTVEARTDQRQWKTTYTYDALGRATEENVEALGDTALVGTSKITRTYDVLGRMTQLTDNNGDTDDNHTLVTWTYTWDDDSTDLTVVEKLYIDDVQFDNVTSVIDNGTLRTSLAYPNGRTLAFAYDALNRLDTITDGGTTLGDYGYKGYYLQDRKLNADVLRLTYKDAADLDGYDAFGRTVWMRHYKVAGGDNAVKLAYGYDYASNPTYQEDLKNDDKDERYTYDSLHRLTAFARGDLTAQKTSIDNEVKAQDWTLDKLGNWTDFDDNGTEDVRQHNEVNEIALPAGGQGQVRTVNDTPREITHDAAGNIATLETNDGSDTYQYAYDYRNRLTLVEYDNGDDIVSYLYDGLNRRVKKDLETGTDILYIYDGWQVVEEHDNAGGGWQVNRQFVYGGQYIDEPLLFDRNDDPETDNDCTEAGDTRYLYCQNANYNVMALTIDNATAVETYQYDPYGACTLVTDDSSGNPYRFQGRRLDPETGLYYFRNRYYWPQLGRFGQRDPMGYVGGTHVYAYVMARPTAWLDPYGAERIKGNKYGEWEVNKGTRTIGEERGIGILIKFWPAKDVVCCEQIMFVQTCQVFDLGREQVVVRTRGARRHRVVEGGWALDRTEGSRLPFFGIGNDGKPLGLNKIGSCPEPYAPAVLSDTPGIGRRNWTVTCVAGAVCTKGLDNGFIYGHLEWGFRVHKGGRATMLDPTSGSGFGSNLLESLRGWNRQAQMPEDRRNHPNQESWGWNVHQANVEAGRQPQRGAGGGIPNHAGFANVLY